ncbi:MAG: polyhydroxyalkanoate synthesis repressor PhaR [Gammaproteobacteria bacterium]|nr:polyhydroxyalkanoate synthesis repressor PhaR [Gammaproteobacteria bacterium]MCY4211632.1 polyhydroxyalkanoate synthesis repressor PhaR [Gammaproteobacteria bacterium]MCY4283374.1 polyhydroxyalkanoate synthesis repressor PhaR [Gammaproteobacteria bacterium]MCY4338786.1 polyhydroxyalkanoate synthesis repressor PhaR [Gammaproteobacteria bacterium]
MRIIKKYPNRRLYDTGISRYITLDDVRKLVLSGIDIRVTDVKTEEDLTRNVLLQIIAEQEHEGKPIFNTLMLTQLIRFYGNAYQSAFSDYLQQSLEMFTAQQQNIQKNLEQAVTGNPITTTMNELTERNLDAWRQLQNSFFQATGFTGKDGKREEGN